MEMWLVPLVSAPGTGLGAPEHWYEMRGAMGRGKSKCWRELVCVFCEIQFGETPVWLGADCSIRLMLLKLLGLWLSAWPLSAYSSGGWHMAY